MDPAGASSDETEDAFGRIVDIPRLAIVDSTGVELFAAEAAASLPGTLATVDCSVAAIGSGAAAPVVGAGPAAAATGGATSVPGIAAADSTGPAFSATAGGAADGTDTTRAGSKLRGST